MRPNHPWLPALVALAVAACALDSADLADEAPALDTTTQHLDYPAGGTCRGTCTEVIDYVTDMAGNSMPYTTYQCVDYEFSAVNPDSRVGTTECRKVAQCLADNRCVRDVAIRSTDYIGPQQTYPAHAKDGYGNTWVEAKVEFRSPKQYFLKPTSSTRQVPSTYTATHPPITANPGAALGGKQPCPVAKERIHGTVTCAAQEPLAACALRHADPSGLINDTERCRVDPQLDVPRQWLHVTGDFPPDAPAGQVQYDVDGTGCAMAIGGLVVKIGGAYLTGGSTTVSPWSFVPAGATAVWKCLPRVQQPQGIDHFIPGGEFVGALPAMYAMNDETAVDVTGEVCSRSISYEWVYTIEAVIYNWADGIPYDAYSIDSIALSNRRYRSGGRVVIVGTEPCVCAQPGETDPKGLDCSTFTNRQRLLSPWKVTDASSVVGHCDFRGCDCTPAEDPVTYTGDLPPHPCPPVMPPMVPPTTEPPPTYPPPVMPPMTSTPTTPPPTYPPPVMPPMTSTPTAPPPMYPAPGPGSGMTP